MNHEKFHKMSRRGQGRMSKVRKSERDGRKLKTLFVKQRFK